MTGLYDLLINIDRRAKKNVWKIAELSCNFVCAVTLLCTKRTGFSFGHLWRIKKKEFL